MNKKTKKTMLFQHEPFFAQLGIVVSHWAAIEYLLSSAIGKISGLSKEHRRALIDKVPARSKIKMLQDLVANGEFDEDAKVDFTNFLVNTIDNLRTRRNDLAHQSWLVIEEEDLSGSDSQKRIIAKSFKANKKLESIEVKVTIPELQKLAEELALAHYHFLEFMPRLGLALP